MTRSAKAVASAAPAITSIKKPSMLDRPIGVDLFCGAGGMSLGFEQAGFEVVGAVDIEKINTETHRKNFPHCKTWCTDLSLVSGRRIREKIGIGNKEICAVFAGPPCQGFSLIGKRDIADPRNRLLLELARLIIELSPSYFAVENVEGILRGKSKALLDEFVERMSGAGYYVVKPIQSLDAAEFGVPQRRRRVFVLGHQEGLPAPKYPSPTHPYDDRGRTTGPTVWDAISDLPRISSHNYLLDSDSYYGQLGEPSAYARVLRGELIDADDQSAPRSTNGHGLTGCLRTAHTPKTISRFRKTPQGSNEQISRFFRLAKDGLALTLRAGTGPDQGSFMAPRPIHPFQNRCITTREAARLHSFPDWFHFHDTKWHAFRQIGNSVPPLLARAVAQCIQKAFQSSHQKG